MRAVLIAGPTASGKSALALALAQSLGGSIINADSMQVYRDLRIITARPTAEEEARVPHRLYGHVDAGESYSTGRWCVEASAALREADVRARIREQLREEGAAALHAELAARDPQMARRLMPRDRTRVARALEVVTATGRSLADWQRDGMRGAGLKGAPTNGAVMDVAAGLEGAPADAVRVFLSVERAELYARIDARFERMLGSGALAEVQALRSRRLDPALPAMKAHGVPWLMRHLAGEIDLAAAVEAAKRDTRRYSKRQVTWFRHQLPEWGFVAPERALAEIRAALGASA
jgi:tRNA dimethylallyltransferase